MSPIGRVDAPAHENGAIETDYWLWVIPLLFISCFIIYHQMEVTLMTLMTASRWLLLFGSGSFVLLYLFRAKLKLDFTDGIIFSIFALMPLLMAGMLTINRFFHEPFLENHRIVDLQIEEGWIVIELEAAAYEDFYRIRHFHSSSISKRDTITYHFGSGLFGWQVMTAFEW